MVTRSPFQGVVNVVQFNLRFYLLALITCTALALLAVFSADPLLRIVAWIACGSSLVPTVVSLIITHLIYDRSNLYQLPWLESSEKRFQLAQIHAGFDECTPQLKQLFPNATIVEFDFFNEKNQTEPSIKKARQKYPPSPNTISISYRHIPLADASTEIVHLMFAAHEIRNHEERSVFLNECSRVLKSEGRIYIIEHLRDPWNFLAYTIGFFHFHSLQTWKQNFAEAGLKIERIQNITPFVHCFILNK
ncbi:MAG: class I SAM-dependent methyltransferase [Chitinophagaceae bacterium]|uniref:class I SAM-dependent methyltransferase n=1 Tax=unclassified Paraflavitalea TaxID=2798305 RepID=UPI003D3546D6|nr:class I SAM-dependent methyltransferase [Chitinophagaceae bacterium]